MQLIALLIPYIRLSTIVVRLFDDIRRRGTANMATEGLRRNCNISVDALHDHYGTRFQPLLQQRSSAYYRGAFLDAMLLLYH